MPDQYGQPTAAELAYYQAGVEEGVEVGAQPDPRVEEMYEAWQAQSNWDQEQQELESYDAEIAAITSDPANQDIQPDLLHSFIAAADGDFEQAVEMYREDQARRQTYVIEQLGLTPEQVAQLQREQRNAQPALEYLPGGPSLSGDGTISRPDANGTPAQRLDDAVERAAAILRR